MCLKLQRKYKRCEVGNSTSSNTLIDGVRPLDLTSFTQGVFVTYVASSFGFNVTRGNTCWTIHDMLQRKQGSKAALS